MVFGFTGLDVLSAFLLVLALVLLRCKEKEDLKRLLDIVIACVVVAAILYEAGRLYLAPRSTDYVSLFCYRTLVMALLGKLTEERCFPPEDEYVQLGVKVFHLFAWLLSVICLFFTALQHV